MSTRKKISRTMREEIICELIKDEEFQKDIAKKFGVSNSYVNKLSMRLKESGEL